MSFEELNEGQVVGVATMGKFLQEQGAVAVAVVPTQMGCGGVVFATLLHSDIARLLCVSLCADVNHVIDRKAKWSRKHRARMRAQI